MQMCGDELIWLYPSQAALDNCMMENYGLERPHYGYHCLPKVEQTLDIGRRKWFKLQVHETDRPAPVETKPEWMNNPKAKKLDSLPENFPRTYKSWGFPGQLNQTGGDI